MSERTSLHALDLGGRATELAGLLAATAATDASGSPADLEASMAAATARLRSLRADNGCVFVAGNGGSAAVASHAVTDFLNVGGLRVGTLHEPAILTCMTNDYGYETAFARILGVQARSNDALIAISSSGKSPNMLNAAAKMREIGGRVITLSGFAADNPLRRLGEVNFWLDSRDYGMVEIGHLFILHNLADRLRLGA